MRLLNAFLFGCSIVVVASVALGQGANPFGDGKDPFGARPAKAKENPKANDPFQNPPAKVAPHAADPFGGGSSNDPFGVPPAKAKKNPTPKGPFQNPPARVAPGSTPPRVMPPSGGVRQPPLSSRPRTVIASFVGESETERRIQATLSDETSLAFVEVPLEEATSAISELHDVPIVIDSKAIEEIGLSRDMPINLNLKKVSLRSFLRLMLREYDLTYLIKDEVLQITTREAAQGALVVAMYKLPASFAPKSKELIEAIQTIVVPESWERLSGPGTMVVFENVLIVSTTSDIHADVEAFVNRIVDLVNN